MIDPACSLAFENEPAERDVMQRPPRDTGASLFRCHAGHRLLQGAGALVVVLAAYGWGLQQMTEEQARAFGFCALVVANLALILSNRSHHVSLLASLRRPNRTLWVVTLATVCLLLLAVAVPALAGLFRFAALPWSAGLLLPALAVVAALWSRTDAARLCAVPASSALAAAVSAVCGLPPHVFGGGTIAIGLPARRTKQVARHVTHRPGLCAGQQRCRSTAETRCAAGCWTSTV